MRALIVEASAPAGIRMAEVAEPEAGPDELVVDVQYMSLNRGDLNDARSGRVPPGAVLGSDFAGVVAAAAASGDGPGAGTRVVGMTSGAFAERCTVPADMVAPIPPGVHDLATAAVLPVAGLAALRSLRAAGVGPGKRVLITGASGGVGRFAVQLAASAGAHVLASVGSAARAEGLADIGADEVVVDLGQVDEPVDVVVDNVGGPTLVAAWNLLAPGGNLQSVGWASGEPAVFPPYSTIGPPRSLTAFLNEGPAAADLAELLSLLEADQRVAPIGWQGPWTEIHQAAAALLDRRVNGKAVLAVTSS